MRLNKYIAQATGLSRREADDFVKKGKVKINGNPAVLGAKVAAADQVLIENQQIHLPNHFTYLLLNKPTGYTTTRRSQDDTPTVYDLLPEQFMRLKYVGRLDKDSSGLLLLTDDGDFTHRMTHPKFGKRKAYEIVLNRTLTKKEFEQVNTGVKLDDGMSALSVCELRDTTYQIRMTEGRNRQIRRTFEAIGLHVKKLHRTHFGDYELGNLPPGKFKEVKLR